MDRTFVVEYEYTDEQLSIIEQIRLRVGDPKILSREYISASDSVSSPKLLGDGSTYWNKETKFWPAALKVDGTTYSGTVVSGTLVNPTVDNYRYINFSSTLRSKVVDFWLDTFNLSDSEIWFIYSRASGRVLERLTVPECLTDNMVFLQACLDCLELIRSMKLTSTYSTMRLQDGDTNFTTQLVSGSDPLRDLRDSLAGELQALIDKCNKTPYRGGIRIE